MARPKKIKEEVEEIVETVEVVDENVETEAPDLVVRRLLRESRNK